MEEKELERELQAAWGDKPCHGDVWHMFDQCDALSRNLAKKAQGATTQREKLEQKLDGKITLQRVENLIDAVWPDQPGPACALAKAHPIEFAGEAHGDKRARLAKDLAKKDETAAVITLPESICWLLNIRGADIPRNPVMQAFALLNADASP